ARIQLQLAIQEGEKHLTKQAKLGAVPLSFNSKCKKLDNDFAEQLDANVKAMQEPEYSAIAKILKAHRTVAFCHSGDVMDIQFPDVLLKLLKQNIQRAITALNQYQHEPEKFIALFKMAMDADYGYCLFMGELETSETRLIKQALLRYVDNSIAYYQQQISQNHELAYLRELFELYKLLDLSSDSNNHEELFELIKKLYRFELELELKVKSHYEGEDLTQTDETTTKGKVVLVLDFDQYGEGMAFPSEGYSMALEGSGTFVSSGASAHQNREENSKSKMIETAFTKRYRVEMNVCESFGKVKLYEPGKSIEKWEGDEPLTSSLNLRMNVTNNTLYVLEFPGIKDFVFPFNIEAAQQLMFEHTFRGQKSYDEGKTKYEADLSLKITHAPQ
ncbi:MAG: hypothetical protein JXR22_08665, partial [Prolixibacteraceae bacterium]|nr:hypothetical protein [Prolixibacteraceae bacterium]